jgi:hypothetical protein
MTRAEICRSSGCPNFCTPCDETRDVPLCIVERCRRSFVITRRIDADNFQPPPGCPYGVEVLLVEDAE